MITRRAFIARRKKLANFLKSLPAKNFDIGNWTVGKYNCGTSACALGWCPKVFPKHWTRHLLTPVLRSSASEYAPHRDACLFFDLRECDEGYCFGSHNFGITAKEVARRLLEAE